MSGTIRVADLPDLGSVTDASSVLCEKSGTGRFTAVALKSYMASGVPEAPTDGATYGRTNASWSQTLPLTGGSIGGNLAVGGNTTVGNILYADSLHVSQINGYEWQIYVEPGSGDHLQAHRANWYDRWANATGIRTWGSPSGVIMTLQPAGNLIAASSVQAPAFWQTNAVGAFGLESVGPTTRVISFDTGNYFDYDTGTHQARWINSNGQFWVMRASDSLCFNALGAVGGQTAYQVLSDRRAKRDIQPARQGLSTLLQLLPVSFTRANRPGTTELGLVAQDVAKVLPEAVHVAGIELPDGSGGRDSTQPSLAVSMDTVTMVSVNAIHELCNMVVELTRRVAQLEGAAA
jgi:hypothetical protein